jgi:hypothetical protein
VRYWQYPRDKRGRDDLPTHPRHEVGGNPAVRYRTDTDAQGIVTFNPPPIVLPEIRVNDPTTKSNKSLGEHENALFAKWLSARRARLTQRATTDRTPAGPITFKLAAQ